MSLTGGDNGMQLSLTGIACHLHNVTGTMAADSSYVYIVAVVTYWW